MLLHYQRLVFHILGQNSYNTLGSRGIASLVLRFLPATVLSMLIGTMAIFTVHYQFLIVGTYDRTDSIIGSLYLISEVLCALLAICQSFCGCSNIFCIFKSFRRIETHLCAYAVMVPNFQTFFERYLRKLAVMLCFYCMMVGSKCIWPPDETGFWMEFQFVFLRLFVLLPKMYALFFISLLKSLIKLSNKLLVLNKHTPLDAIESSQWRTIGVIKHYKCIHFKLFTAAEQINETFGWSLTAICVESMWENAFMLYWIFFYWHKENEQSVLIISKYILIQFSLIRSLPLRWSLSPFLLGLLHNPSYKSI